MGRERNPLITREAGKYEQKKKKVCSGMSRRLPVNKKY